MKVNNLSDFIKMLSAESPHRAGRNLYRSVGCGPWLAFIRDGAQDVYYEDKLADTVFDGCVGVKIGSIVEGSDVEITPVELMFPFNEDDFWQEVTAIDEEASFYWERDNLDTYQINFKGRFYHMDVGFGVVFHDNNELSAKDKKIIEKFVLSMADSNNGSGPVYNLGIDVPKLDNVSVFRIDKSDFIY